MLSTWRQPSKPVANILSDPDTKVLSPGITLQVLFCEREPCSTEEDLLIFNLEQKLMIQNFFSFYLFWVLGISPKVAVY